MKTAQKFWFCVVAIILFAANADAGRWLTRDPIEFMERDPRPDAGDFQEQLNLYRFVDNNPINLIDPLGLDPRSDLLGAIEGGDPAQIQVVIETWGDALSPGLRNQGFNAIKRIAAQKARQEAEQIAAEQAAKKLLENKLKTRCGDLIRGTFKRSESYHSELEDKTYGELLKDTSSAAKDMLKLIKEADRLAGKNLP